MIDFAAVSDQVAGVLNNHVDKNALMGDPRADVTEFLKTKEIAKFKLPERMLVLDDFPVSTFGKVSKKQLSEIAERDAHH